MSDSDNPLPQRPARRPRKSSGRFWPAVRAVLRTRIVAGLLTVIPIWVTWVVVTFVFDMMRSLTEPLAQRVAVAVIEANKDKELISERVLAYLEWAVPAFAVLLTLFFLYVLGLLGASVFGSRLIRAFEQFFERVPFVKTVYKMTRQIVTTLGSDQSVHAKRVVLVEYPYANMKAVAFLTSVMIDKDTGRPMASLFIPTTPNPAVGYLQVTPLESVSELDWTVEETVKRAMSGGILSPATIRYDKFYPVVLDAVAPEAKPGPMDATKDNEK